MNISPIKQLSFGVQLLIVFLVLTQVSFMPWFEANVPYETKFIISLCIGGMMFLCVLALNFIVNFSKLLPNLLLFSLLLAIAVIAGSLVGAYIGVELSGIRRLFPENVQNSILTKLISWGIYLGSAVCLFFILHRKISIADETIWKEKLKRLEYNKQLAEAQLRILQAQIEPHFLFNSLANILSLIDIDADSSKRMLESFIKYLRMTLDKSREQVTSLNDEVDMITAYLNIFKLRMGDRLNFDIRLSEEAIMLLQPLVENAMRHGLEPIEDGGEIRIYDQIGEASLSIIVEDTGTGLNCGGDSNGFGLKNVNERLNTLFGSKGHLNIESNHPRGVKATVTIPRASI